MELELIYQELKKRVDNIDFSLLCPGFHSYKFAIYRENECIYDGEKIERESEFLANTAILYQGEYIAIWNIVEEVKDYDALAASIIHEMFHAHQHTNQETRWANEMEGLLHYHYEEENIASKLLEAKLMKNIISYHDIDSYKKLLQIRKYRQHKYPYEYEYESKIEQIEGSANAIEIKALAQLDQNKAMKRWESLFQMIENPINYLPIRIISYYIGVALIECMDICSKENPFQFDDIPFSMKVIQDIPFKDFCFTINPNVSEAVNIYKNKTHQIIQDTLEKNEIVLEGEYPLMGLNVYDARWEEPYAISSYFVAYNENDEMRVLEGNYVIEMDHAYHIHKIYKQ